jgi:hypothetical protein
VRKVFERCKASARANVLALMVHHVTQALLELGDRIQPGELARMAKARVEENLIRPPKDPRVAHGYVRTALEVDGQLGGPSELHLHQHHSLPPAAQKLLEDKFAEMFGQPMQAKKQEEQALTISGATAPEVQH